MKLSQRLLLFVCFFALYNLTALAQTAVQSRVIHVSPKPSVHVPAQEIPAGLKAIYTSLAKLPAAPADW